VPTDLIWRLSRSAREKSQWPYPDWGWRRNSAVIWRSNRNRLKDISAKIRCTERFANNLSSQWRLSFNRLKGRTMQFRRWKSDVERLGSCHWSVARPRLFAAKGTCPGFTCLNVRLYHNTMLPKGPSYGEFHRRLRISGCSSLSVDQNSIEIPEDSERHCAVRRNRIGA